MLVIRLAFRWRYLAGYPLAFGLALLAAVTLPGLGFDQTLQLGLQVLIALTSGALCVDPALPLNPALRVDQYRLGPIALGEHLG